MQPASSSSGTRENATAGPKTVGEILIVDDEVFIQNAFRLYFETLGYKAHIAGCGETALRAFRDENSKLDVVLLDLVMPGCSGLDLLKVFKTEQPDVSVIIATGCGSISSAIEAIRNGAFDYITKPIVDFEEDLLRVVKDAIVERRRRQQGRNRRDFGAQHDEKIETVTAAAGLLKRLTEIAEELSRLVPATSEPVTTAPPDEAMLRLEAMLTSRLGMASGLLFRYGDGVSLEAAHAWGDARLIEFHPRWFSDRGIYQTILEGEFSVFASESLDLGQIGFSSAGCEAHPVVVHLPMVTGRSRRGCLLGFLDRSHGDFRDAGFLLDGRPFQLLAPLLSSFFEAVGLLPPD